MINVRHVITVGMLALAVLAALPAAAADTYGRNYSLHTLDYRVAESLVWEICEQEEGKSARCMVQSSSPGGLTVFASQEVHALVVAMLAERDQRVPTSLLFEIVLVRLVEEGSGGASARAGRPQAEHLNKAIDALLEIFPNRHPEIIDTGLIRTAGEGMTRVGNERDGYYEAALALRTTTRGATGMEFTLDLEIARRTEHENVGLLASTLTIAAGETVVAGSSRVDGEPVIVVLLTSKPL